MTVSDVLNPLLCASGGLFAIAVAVVSFTRRDPPAWLLGGLAALGSGAAVSGPFTYPDEALADFLRFAPLILLLVVLSWSMVAVATRGPPERSADPPKAAGFLATMALLGWTGLLMAVETFRFEGPRLVVSAWAPAYLPLLGPGLLMLRSGTRAARVRREVGGLLIATGVLFIRQAIVDGQAMHLLTPIGLTGMGLGLGLSGRDPASPWPQAWWRLGLGIPVVLMALEPLTFAWTETRLARDVMWRNLPLAGPSSRLAPGFHRAFVDHWFTIELPLEAWGPTEVLALAPTDVLPRPHRHIAWIGRTVDREPRSALLFTTRQLRYGSNIVRVERATRSAEPQFHLPGIDEPLTAAQVIDELSSADCPRLLVALDPRVPFEAQEVFDLCSNIGCTTARHDSACWDYHILRGREVP